MNEKTFWEIIDAARKAARGDIESYAEALEEKLRDCSPEELVSFEQLFDRRVNEAYQWPMWGAAYLINGGCSDDGFFYFRGWLVMQGQEAFDRALGDPDSLAALIKPDVDAECEEVLYVPRELYREKTGQEMPYESTAGDPAREPAGRPWTEDQLEDLFPRIAGVTS